MFGFVFQFRNSSGFWLLLLRYTGGLIFFFLFFWKPDVSVVFSCFIICLVLLFIRLLLLLTTVLEAPPMNELMLGNRECLISLLVAVVAMISRRIGFLFLFSGSLMVLLSFFCVACLMIYLVLSIPNEELLVIL